ncbi:MAG: LPS export ABC transporter ATP-binding protein [Gammaproteobacteria bacterium]|nr:LPS export ABC transporter ATP-binding protein [Gammaproteobacteria bacterium]
MNNLRAENLHKQFDTHAVVQHVNLDVQSSEIVGLLGPNGAGKTTCFYMLAGLLRTTEGRIILNDLDITHMPMHLRARHGIGYLPQEPSIFRGLTVEQNIMVSLEARDNLGKRQRKQLCDDLLANLRIEHIRDSKGIQLSGGERRRAEIARALATEPKFILLDEPFTGVDPISVKDIQQILKDLCSHGIGLLITDHNVRETLGICDRAYILSDGHVLAKGPPSSILANQQVQDTYLGKHFSMG